MVMAGVAPLEEAAEVVGTRVAADHRAVRGQVVQRPAAHPAPEAELITDREPKRLLLSSPFVKLLSMSV